MSVEEILRRFLEIQISLANKAYFMQLPIYAICMLCAAESPPLTESGSSPGWRLVQAIYLDDKEWVYDPTSSLGIVTCPKCSVKELPAHN